MGRMSVVGKGLNSSGTEPKSTVLFWISIVSSALGVRSNMEGNLITGRLMSKEGTEGIKEG